MIKLKPLPNLEVLISQKSDGSFTTEDQVKQFLSDHNINKPICYFHHRHQAHRVICNQPKPQISEKIWADGVITNQKNVCLGMVVADCFPLILADPKKNIVSLIHAGWKPLLQNIIELTMQDLKYKFNINPKDIYAWIGPGIRSCCYQFEQKPIQMALDKWQSAINKNDSKYEIDLSKFIKTELKRLNLETNKILDQNICTCCNKNLFSHYQARENHSVKDGRFLVAVHQK